MREAVKKRIRLKRKRIRDLYIKTWKKNQLNQKVIKGLTYKIRKNATIKRYIWLISITRMEWPRSWRCYNK